MEFFDLFYFLDFFVFYWSFWYLDFLDLLDFLEFLDLVLVLVSFFILSLMPHFLNPDLTFRHLGLYCPKLGLCLWIFCSLLTQGLARALPILITDD